MYEQKTRPDTGDVDEFLARLDDAQKRDDSQTLIELMRDLTGEPPVLWGTMIGFGRYHYTYASGHSGESFLVGFAPRKPAFSIYLMGESTEQAERDALLSRLGKHRMGKGCLYVNRLSDIDIDILRQLAERSVRAIQNRYPGTN